MRKTAHFSTMRKEILVAILFGIVFGVSAAFGVWRANSVLKSQRANMDNSSNDQQSNKSTTSKLNLTIASPEENDVIAESSVDITGITKANTLVAVSSEEEDYILRSDNSGNFTAKIELVSGINQVIVGAVDETQNKEERILTLVYSSGFDKDTQTPTPTGEMDDAEEIREKVQEKIRSVLAHPKAYIGTITDKTANTIQVRNKEGTILLISINPEKTTYIRMGKTNTEVKFADIAIGDFIAALGTQNENNVLEVTRVLVTQPVAPPKRKIQVGKVGKVEKKVLTLKEADGKETQSTFPKTWKGPEIEDFSDGDSVVVITEEDEKSIQNIRAIELLTFSPTPTKSE